MATLERIHFVPHYLVRRENAVAYSPSSSRPSIEGLPQIFWADYAPWREANLWAVERATTGDASLKTVASNMNGLLNYAKFLESRDLQWFEFPARKADRCLVLYRGALIKMRDAGQISPSTASEYMRNCIMFYRWVRHRELLSPHVQLWREKPYVVKYFDRVGFERTISGTTTDLSIPNRKRQAKRLKMGCCQSRRPIAMQFWISPQRTPRPSSTSCWPLDFLPGCGSAASVISRFNLWSAPPPTFR